MMTREQVDCVRPGSLLQLNLGAWTHMGIVLEVVEEDSGDEWVLDHFVVSWNRPDGTVVTHEPVRQLLSEQSNVTLLFGVGDQNG